MSFKNIHICRVKYQLAKRIKIICSVRGSSLFSPIPFNAGILRLTVFLVLYLC